MKQTFIIAVIYTFFLGGCLSAVNELYPKDESLRPVPVYLISHGWHVGIAVEAEYIREKVPSHEAIPQTRFLKFGWGDHKYYTTRDPGVGLLLRAALLPTKTVLHVVGIDYAVESYFASSDVIRVQVTEEGMENLADFIAGYFRRTDEGCIIYQSDGLYVNSSFFEADGRYYIPRTSNRWTARALRQTGAPITPFYSVTSGNVIQQSRNFGEVLNLRQ